MVTKPLDEHHPFMEKALTHPLTSRWGSYGFAILSCLGLESLLLGLGWTDLGVPYLYHYDFLYNSALIKGIVDHGWYLNNPSLGAPGGLAMHDYPEVANFNYLLVKLLTLFTSDWAKVANLFYILTFPLAAVSALYVFRNFKVPSPVAFTGSILFAFAPYHYLRLHHLVYTNYFFIPLVTMVLLWIMSGKQLIVFRDANSGRWKFNMRSGPALGCIVIALLVSGSVIYYSFFSCFFFLVAGAVAYLNKRHAGSLFTSWVLIGVICAGVVLQMAPTWIYKMNHGDNPLVVMRPAKETEEYGLKIAQLLLPTEGHRVKGMAQLRERYDRTAPLNNENRFSSLGLAGSIGFLALLIGLFRRRVEGDEDDGLSFHLASLNISALLLGTIGGFSALFAYWVNAQIRAYNRISIFIEFFAIFAFVLLLAYAYKNLVKTKLSPLVSYAMCGAVLVFGLLDQTPMSFKTPYPDIKKQFEEDAAFYKQIEQSLSGEGMVFQLPFVGFPISKGPSRMTPYDHIRGYLHTRTMKWSYGAITGRETDLWQQSVSLLRAQDMVNTLVFAGFRGIYLDRMGYADDGQQMIQDFSRILGQSPTYSEGSSKVFFLLNSYAQNKKHQTPPEEWKTLQQSVLTDPLVYVGKNLFQPANVILPAVGFVEVVTPRFGEPKQLILVGGWAVDPETRTPVKKMMVVHEGKASQLFVSTQIPRLDIARKLGTENALKSQWSVVLDTRTWASGKHSFEIYALLEGDRLGRLAGCDSKCSITLSHR
jgi:phosphoglycerol transferase